jgi:hypothetical protein
MSDVWPIQDFNVNNLLRDGIYMYIIPSAASRSTPQ